VKEGVITQSQACGQHGHLNSGTYGCSGEVQLGPTKVKEGAITWESGMRPLDTECSDIHYPESTTRRSSTEFHFENELDKTT
jgi:hypothetical protein